MTGQGKVVLLAFYFPPLSSVGYKRPLRLANFLARAGWEVVVFAGNPKTQPSFSGVDAQLLERIHPAVKVIRPWSLHGIEWVHGLVLNRERSGRPSAKKRDGDQPKQRPFWKRALDRIETLFEIPDRFSAWILFALPGLLFEILRKKPAAIYATGPPWSPFVSAILAGTIFRIPVTLDYRDPWHDNAYARTSPLTLRLERSLVGRARTILSATQSMAEILCGRFPSMRSCFHHVYNGYDAAERIEIENALRNKKEDPTAFVLAHVGTLYAQRLSEEMACSFASAAAAWKHKRPLRFSFSGWMEKPEILERAFQKKGMSEHLEIFGRVNTKEALRRQIEADVLLLLQPGTKVQLPAKMFEYALTRNRILCVAPKDSETVRIVTRYRLGEVIGPEEMQSVDTVIERLLLGPSQARLDSFLKDFEGDRLASIAAGLMLGPRPSP